MAKQFVKDAPAVAVTAMCAEDWPDVARIYGEGILTGDATFELSVPDWHEWNAAHLQEGRLVARVEHDVAGWAALAPASRRHVYRGVAEASIYVGSAHRGRGVGMALARALIVASEEAGIWTLQAGIFPANTASVRLVERCGFRLVGRRERLGRMPAGRWRDVLVFERRSAVVGLDRGAEGRPNAAPPLNGSVT